MHSQKRSLTGIRSESIEQPNSEPFTLPSISELLDSKTVDAALTLSSLFSHAAQNSSIVETQDQSQHPASPQAIAPVYFSAPHFVGQSNNLTSQAPVPLQIQDQGATIVFLDPEMISQATALGFTKEQLYEIAKNNPLPNIKILDKLLKVPDITPHVITEILKQPSGRNRIMLLFFVLGTELSWEKGPIHELLSLQLSNHTRDLTSEKFLKYFTAEGIQHKNLVFAIHYYEQLRAIGFTPYNIGQLITPKSGYLKMMFIANDLKNINMDNMPEEQKKEYIRKLTYASQGVPAMAEVIMCILTQQSSPHKEASLSNQLLNNKPSNGNGAIHLRGKNILSELAQQELEKIAEQVHEQFSAAHSNASHVSSAQPQTSSHSQKRSHDGSREDGAAPPSKKGKMTVL